jgi:hypothetical protein
MAGHDERRIFDLRGFCLPEATQVTGSPQKCSTGKFKDGFNAVAKTVSGEFFRWSKRPEAETGDTMQQHRIEQGGQ